MIDLGDLFFMLGIDGILTIICVNLGGILGVYFSFCITLILIGIFLSGME